MENKCLPLNEIKVGNWLFSLQLKQLEKRDLKYLHCSKSFVGISNRWQIKRERKKGRKEENERKKRREIGRKKRINLIKQRSSEKQEYFSCTFSEFSLSLRRKHRSTQQSHSDLH